MHFDIVHDFDIPLDALELAVLSPDLWEKMATRVPNVATLVQKVHDLHDGILERVWTFQPNVRMPHFAREYVTEEMMGYDEKSTYDLGKHEATWQVIPHVKPAWQKYVTAAGKYALKTAEAGHTRRVVTGELKVEVPIFGAMAERLIMAEVRKIFEAEAGVLRDLATLT